MATIIDYNEVLADLQAQFSDANAQMDAAMDKMAVLITGIKAIERLARYSRPRIAAPKRIASGSQGESVLGLFIPGSAMTPADVSLALGINRRHAAMAMARLVISGKIVRVQPGQYILPLPLDASDSP
jgi:hypothetical protein